MKHSHLLRGTPWCNTQYRITSASSFNLLKEKAKLFFPKSNTLYFIFSDLGAVSPPSSVWFHVLQQCAALLFFGCYIVHLHSLIVVLILIFFTTHLFFFLHEPAEDQYVVWNWDTVCESAVSLWRKAGWTVVCTLSELLHRNNNHHASAALMKA